jgi:tRNA threonylcarbamoyladenosine biosynthesis protein TsaB
MILSIETSTEICSIALHDNGELLSYFEIRAEKSHSEHITLLIKSVLDFAKVQMNQLNAIAISRGPGSYTGLRIASSTAKGLCYALNIPFIAVDTLQAMALGFANLNQWVCPMLDARRLEIFCAMFDAQNQMIQPIESKILENAIFDSFLEQNKIIFIGNAVEKSEPFIQHPNACLIKGVHPSAKNIGLIANLKFIHQEFENVVTFEPFYLKEFYMANKKAD